MLGCEIKRVMRATYNVQDTVIASSSGDTLADALAELYITLAKDGE
jgi:hypothetical protein